jgi:hypothetical protein
LDYVSAFPVQSHGERVHQETGNTAGPGDRAGSGRTPDDDYADLLVRMWSLATGRIPRLAVRPSQLTEQELLWFWDDEAPAGRHARTGRSFRAGATR